MRRRTLITTLAVLVVTAAAAATAIAGSSGGEQRPPFARSYVGTVAGTLRTSGQVDTWTVQRLTFKLQKARYARGRWGGTYLVTSGHVSFTTKATGECKSTKSGSFALGRLSWDAASISFLQNLGPPGGYGYQARVSKQHPVNVTKQCADGFTMRELVSPAGGFWLGTNIGERMVPGKRLAGRYVIREDGGTRTWTWNLVPR
jgi:hypothetical protein